MTGNVDRQATPHVSTAEYRRMVQQDLDGGTAPTRQATGGPRRQPKPPSQRRRKAEPIPRQSGVVAGHPLTVAPAVLRIIGTPRTQGSKQALVRNDGSVFMREGGDAAAHAMFKSWRQAVAQVGAEWLRSVGYPAPFDGPVRIDALFLLAKPPSRPKAERLPRTGLDRDKLERALHDGLSVDAPILANDSRICAGVVGKLWAVDTTPGAVVRIVALAEDDWRRFPLAQFVWPN